MKNLLLRFVLILLLIPAAASPVYAEDTAAQIKNLFQRYMDAWNQGELMTIGSEVYRPPLYIFDAEQTQILSTAEDIAAFEDDEQLTDADIAVYKFAKEWLEANNKPHELIQAMAGFVESVVIEAVAIH